MPHHDFINLKLLERGVLLLWLIWLTIEVLVS
jgi:hypothetical protein